MKLSIIVLLCSVTTGLLAQTHPFEKARWISPDLEENATNRPCRVFRKIYQSDKVISSAKLYITAHGLYEAMINGKRVGMAYFTPGFTSYPKRLQYQVYDATSLLIKGKNKMMVTVADGWWHGVFGGDMKNNRYGGDASLLAQLEITYKDGSKQLIASDTTWRSAAGSIRSADFYNGEMQDTRIKAVNWNSVNIGNYLKDNLVPSISDPVTKHEQFKPVKIIITPQAEQVIDFGQNMAGWVQIKVKGKNGDTVKVSHAEILDKDGNFYTGNLRLAKATDVYILNGKEQVLEPHFTYHGFRYIKVTGFKPTKVNCTAIAVYSDLKHTGTFSCSDPMINRLQHNIEWSLNSNFVDIPTDCPQRSERFGWTGDVQVFSSTAAFNRNVKKFYTKWTADLAADQGRNGGVPTIVPDFREPGNDKPKYGVAGWGDAATILPWTVYKIYRDTAILKQQYPSMKAWVDYIISTVDTTDYLWKNNGYGDWYAPGPVTDITYIDQCFFAHSTDLLIETATLLDKKKDVQVYTRVLKKAKSAFLKLYQNNIQNTQTAEVLALQFDLLPADLRQEAADHLAQLIHANNNHLATGFLGTPYLLNVLSRYGYSDLAYRILTQETIPSWLYPITKGATTIWEKWDAIRPDNTLDTCSLNHYAYGAVGEWLYQNVAGINASAPGYKKIIIRPEPGGRLTWATASYQCHYGKIVSNWKIKNNHLQMRVEIPKGTTAMVYVPGNAPAHIGAGKFTFRSKKLTSKAFLKM